jgi:hypothetical protein
MSSGPKQWIGTSETAWRVNKFREVRKSGYWVGERKGGETNAIFSYYIVELLFCEGGAFAFVFVF